MTDDKYSRLIQMDIISTKSYNTTDKVSSIENNSGTDTIYSKFEVDDDELLRIANLSLKDLNECSNSIGNDIGFEVDLPKNTLIDGSLSRFYLIEKHTYTNFNISMEAKLSTNFKNMSGAELQTRCSHQSVDKEINWGEITFTTTPPFISYSYKGFLWIKHNSFDSGLFSSIILNF